MVKRENLVTYRMLGVGMTPSYVEFLKADNVPSGNYPNAVVLKDSGHGFALGYKLPVNGTPPKSNGEIRTPFTTRHPG